MLRVNKNSNTEEEVVQYFKTRNLQLSQNGLFWDNILYKNKLGYIANFTDKEGNQYSSFYVLLKNRKLGYSKQILKEINNKICTINDCEIVSFLEKQDKPFEIFNGLYDSVEYKEVELFYGSRKAKRSKVYLMNHIDEGIFILSELNKSYMSKTAFCLHPLIQDDDNLSLNFETLTKSVPSYSLGLSLEYRNIANAYLSKREISTLEDIHLSPLQEVNDMLIADKIQNYKDFLLYHKDTHPRRNELTHYFNNWLKKLNCEDFLKKYIEISKNFDEKVKIINI